MATGTPKQLHWIRQSNVPAAAVISPRRASVTDARERLVAALADRPRTVAQLALGFGVAPPTMLEQVRRALQDGLIVEIQVPEAEKRFAAERYYAPAVPVVRQPDRDLLESACRALANEVAAALAANQGDLEAAFAMTHLARDGWTFADLWPYVQETIARLAFTRAGITRIAPVPAHGLAWVEDAWELEAPPAGPAAEEEIA